MNPRAFSAPSIKLDLVRITEASKDFTAQGWPHNRGCAATRGFGGPVTNLSRLRRPGCPDRSHPREEVWAPSDH